MDLFRWLRNQWDRTVAVVLALLGLIAIFLGWLGVSRGVLPSQQIPYLASGGIVGLFLLGVGATLWLSSDLRDEWRKLDQVAEEIREASSRIAQAGVFAEPGSNGVDPPQREPATATPPTRPRRSPVRAKARAETR